MQLKIIWYATIYPVHLTSGDVHDSRGYSCAARPGFARWGRNQQGVGVKFSIIIVFYYIIVYFITIWYSIID